MRRRGALAAGIVVLGVVAYWPAKAFLIERYGVSELTVGSSLVLQWLGVVEPEPELPPVAALAPAPTAPTKVEFDPAFTPFREIGGRLGPRARSNSMIMAGGVAIFDANGDGRLDLYFPHRGRPIAKATREHILSDDRVPAKPGALFLHLGNDERGDPIYRAVQELQAEGDGEYLREELLIENKYRPRTSLDDDEFGPGRISFGAIAADFNGDGRLDLYVLSLHYGLLGQTHELGFRAYPARNNLGRGARGAREAVVIRYPSFLWGALDDGLHQTVDFGGTPEPEGRNTLFLNLGDRDGDGIPEWEDATERAGVGGRWASTSAAVADFDRDGDLDLYVANFLDPDFWGFGAEHFAGNRNQLYVNQIAETGELSFRDAAEELRVAGLHDEEELVARVWLPSERSYRDTSLQIVDGKPVGEKADHSWAALFSDFNQDGWPDLIVANDVSNRLRVYENVEGRSFRYLRQFDDALWDGCWMGMSVGDLDGDMSEEIFVTNCGSQVMSVRNNALMVEDSTEANLQALSVLNYLEGKSTLHHVLLQPDAKGALADVAPQVRVEHSPYIPPDMSSLDNFAPMHLDLFNRYNFANSLTSYEFAWNAPMFDVDNDGDLDLYFAGSLQRGNDDFVGDWSGSPGRLLANESAPGKLRFRDRTLEYRLLDIAHLDYDVNPPRRAAPGTGWHKRDYIYLTDTDAYAGMGLEASKSATHDIFRMHEAANSVLAADLNDDGFVDLLLNHTGGYNSTSPAARNLKVAFAGRVLAVPAPNKVMKPPTNFEEGAPFLYINSGPPKGSEGRWVSLRLSSPDSFNRFGVGARVVVNGELLRHHLVGAGAAFGGVTGDLHVGLGSGALRTLEIAWPDGAAEPQTIAFDPPLRDRRICVDRRAGHVPCGAS